MRAIKELVAVENQSTQSGTINRQLPKMITGSLETNYAKTTAGLYFGPAPLPESCMEHRTMTRRNLVLAITGESGLQQIQVKRIVKKIFEAIIDTLIEDGRVELRNFGVFEVRHRKARNGRNLHTGKKIFIPDYSAVFWMPGKAMEMRINDEYRKETAGREVLE